MIVGRATRVVRCTEPDFHENGEWAVMLAPFDRDIHRYRHYPSRDVAAQAATEIEVREAARR